MRCLFVIDTSDGDLCHSVLSRTQALQVTFDLSKQRGLVGERCLNVNSRDRISVGLNEAAGAQAAGFIVQHLTKVARR